MTRILLTAENYGGLYDLWAQGKSMICSTLKMNLKICRGAQGDKDQYYEYALYGRNKGMADAAESFLKDGKNYFFMVGASTLPETGALTICWEKGYTVERLH